MQLDIFYVVLILTLLGVTVILFRKMKDVTDLQGKIDELDKSRQEERQAFERWQAVNSEQMKQLTIHLTNLQGNVGGSIQRMTEQFSKNTFQLSSSLQKNLEGMTQSLDTRLNKTTESLEKVSHTHLKLIEETRGIQTVGKDIAELQRILKAPKLRGILGELSLENLLFQIYPKEGFILQYPFKSGVVADAVLKLKDERLLVIDSKFAHSKFSEIIHCEDNEKRKKLRREFMQDVKKHINAIAEKYILPDERTLDFALMYIPAENIYYEVIIRDQQDERSILDYAYKHKVFPVSPNTLYAYLTTIAMGLRGLEVNKKAQKILDYLGRLSQEYVKFRKDFNVLGGHIGKTQSKYEESSRRLNRLGNKMDQAQSLRGRLKKIADKNPKEGQEPENAKENQEAILFESPEPGSIEG